MRLCDVNGDTGLAENILAKKHSPCNMELKTFLHELGIVQNVVIWVGVLVLILVTIQSARTWWRLRHIPGPFLASITDLYRINWVRSKEAHLKLQKCHEKYGKVVRIGPNTVSFSDPVAIPIVYPMRPGIPKVSAMSAVWRPRFR